MKAGKAIAMLSRLAMVSAMLAQLMEPAFAQPGSSPLIRPTTHEPTQTEIQQQKDEEKAYQSAVRRIPGPVQKPDDPWGDVRSTPSIPPKKKKMP